MIGSLSSARFNKNQLRKQNCNSNEEASTVLEPIPSSELEDIENINSGRVTSTTKMIVGAAGKYGTSQRASFANASGKMLIQ